MMWIPSLKAFRAGGVTGTQWDVIGEYSSAFGKNNIVEGQQSTAFGVDNEVYANSSAAFGLSNIIEVSNYGSFASGSLNINSNNLTFTHSFQNTNAGFCTTIFGNENSADGEFSFICGSKSRADANYASVIGYNAKVFSTKSCAIGNNVTADGEQSFALGSYVETNGYEGSFVIGDRNGGPNFSIYRKLPNNINQMVMRFTGTPNDTSVNNKTYRFITAINNDGIIINECFLAANSNGLITTSDSNKKKYITPVNTADILEDMRTVPIKTWQWKEHWTYSDTNLVYDSLSYTRMGPMAQDFYGAFPIGFPDSSSLSTSVMNAVMFVSIQELANIADTLKAAYEDSYDKSNNIEKRVDSSLTKKEFYLFKDSIDCYADICDRLDELEKNNDNFVTKTEFFSFKDTINCYKDACLRISTLEEIIEVLKARIDSLESGNIIINDDNEVNIKAKIYPNSFSDIILEQNNLNPFAEKTKINYYIPFRYDGSAKLVVTDENGRNVYYMNDICIGKPCQVEISAKELDTEVYLYSIEIEGQLIKTMKFMIIK